MPPTRKERGKTERYYRMRENVVDIAVELFSKNGYNGTGVADIGDAAGLARGALYYYIGSKDALLVEIHDRVMDPLLKEAAAIVELDLGFQTRLRLLSESLLWQIVNRHDHVWVFLHEYRRLQGEHRESFREKRRRFESRIRGVLADGHRGGLLQGHPQEDLELATLAFLNLHNYTYQWLAGHRDMRVEELSAFYCDIFFNGILADPVDRARAEEELEQGRSVLQELRGVKSEVSAKAEA
ncbi:TetR/AcrR family transcriptional regulator [Streptomyces sp. SID12501]|uniref:TetR/AcrR family transcriptional regulator n=1 Tax=Streptomyces sp. SID12501 TaxID=2706042 RepID=A0A6B3C7N3_9ACTN|nr:TetR/AcrR family transcriptional regulator [Streptomyces sp. SID12501]NEC92444.1 TetR/AcrR family transcriptional regulator [Streptomyces sp. SID12501]